jgi:Putative adhesin Stv domain
MTKHVVVGHGGFDPTTSNIVPEVLVPPDTKLQFFADAGQELVVPSKDYESVAKELWDQLKRPTLRRLRRLAGRALSAPAEGKRAQGLPPASGRALLDGRSEEVGEA